MELIIGILIFLGGGSTLAALFTTLVYLFPVWTDQAAEALRVVPGRSLLLGLVNALFFGILGALLGQAEGIWLLLGLLLWLLLAGGAAIGVAGLLIVLRQRLFAELVVWTPGMTLNTAVLLVAAALSPMIGWFLFTPLALIMGLGAAIIAWRRGKGA